MMGSLPLQLMRFHVFASRKYPDKIPAATQIISKIDYQQKEFWMRNEADPESKN